MKKAFFVWLLCPILAILPGCSLLGLFQPLDGVDPPPTRDYLPTPPTAEGDPSEETASPADPEANPEPEPSPEELLAALRFHLDLINQCYAETCGAELGSTEYSRVYTSEEAMMAGEAPIEIVERSTIDGSNLTDLTDSVLYEILNFKTNAEALAYLEQYMVPDVAQALFPNEFLEMDGKLYMVYGGRGYGAEQLDLNSAAISVSGDTCSVTLDLCLFEEKSGTCTVSFAKQGENWIITAIDGGAA